MTVVATVVALFISDEPKQAVALICTWPVSLPLLIYKEVKAVYNRQDHVLRLEDKSRELESFESRNGSSLSSFSLTLVQVGAIVHWSD